MDALEKKILELNHKVDDLQTIVERLSYQITNLVATKPEMPTKEVHQSSFNAEIVSVSSSPQKSVESFMEHKDILLDNSSWHHHVQAYQEQTVSSDIQIRRLTAQLTAAYNRIAALEEQLLARQHNLK